MALAPTELSAAQEDIDAVMSAARDYIDGYVDGNPERHARAYHPECIKRRYITDPDSGVDELIVISPRVMTDYAALSEMSDCESEVIIDDISENMASVRIYSCRWVDFLHVVKARGEWKLFHVTWHGRPDS